MRRLGLLAVFLGLLSASFFVAPSDAQSNRLQQIADGVWFRLGDRSQGHCNNILIELEEGLLVVDANFPSGAEETLADAKRISSKPVKYVFDTHHHGDHAYGNPVWTKAGATTLAYVGVAEEMIRYEPNRWRSAAETREDVRKLNRGLPEPPQQTFRETPFVLEDGRRRVEFHHFGWAHTRGDGFVFLPEEKILCTGDAAVNGPFNFTGDGNSGNWPNVMRQAEQLQPEHVLPGHGPAGGAEILAGQRAFFEELDRAVTEAYNAGRKLEEIVAFEESAAKTTELELPEKVANWVGPNLPEQVRVRYMEVSTGRPHGTLSGGE